MPVFIDTHCHLDFPEYDTDRSTVIARAKDEGIGYIINIGSSLTGSQKSVELARQYDFIYATVGLHPHEADKFTPEIQKTLETLAGEEKVVAIGEIGLDYYKNYSSKENQRKLFTIMLGLAKKLDLPIVIHNRQADADVLAMLKPLLPHKITLHCFSGDEDFLKTCLDLGFFVSFTCNITYKKAEGLRSLVKIMPLERLFLETDAPFLSPEGFRGKRNEPLQVKLLAEEVARIKGISLEEVAGATTDNAKTFFDLK